MPALESDADRLAMLHGLGGETITVAGVPVLAIVDNEYADALGVAGTQPVATCRSVDVAHAARGSAVQRAQSAFRVANVEHDGTGITLLRLERA